MSEHTFRSPDGKRLTTGYDRRLGEFFFSVYSSASDLSPCHSSARDVNTDLRTLRSVRSIVEAYVDGVPQSLWDSVEDDALNDVGSRVVHWTDRGTIVYDSAAEVIA